MKTEALERHDRGAVNVELCFSCACIWFDHAASVELAPAAVISLFKEIHAHRATTRQALAGRMACPRCGDALVLSYDLCKSGRFSYYRCVRGDGRLTPFLQFLREKQFVRSLTPAEIGRVRVQVRQVNCSQCGAPVDLELATECKYCHAPLSLLDPDAVEKAVRMWSEVQNRRNRSPTPGAVTEALAQAQHGVTQRASSHAPHLKESVRKNSAGVSGFESGLDLIGRGIHILGCLLEEISSDPILKNRDADRR
jgi:hypothetical protein